LIHHATEAVPPLEPAATVVAAGAGMGA